MEVSFEIKANPTLTLTSKDCAADLLTYDIVFASNGTVESTAGTVSGNTVTGIPAGTDVTLTATLNGCTTDLEVTAPDCSCPVIAVPTDGVPAAVCFGDANVAISASVLAGETIDWYADATGGTALVSGSLSYTSSETAVDVYTYYAEARNTTTNCVSDSRLEVSFEIKANPTLTLTSKDCAADLLTYDIVFASNGTVESTAGTVSGNTVTGIPAGTDVTLTATLNGCTTDLEVTAPDCSCPVIAVPTDGVPAAVCFGDANVAISASVLAGETIDWYADATGGTALVSGSLSYTSSETAVDVYTYYAEARNTTTNCVSDSRLEVSFEIKANPTLTLTSKDCAADLLTYDIVFASNGTVESTAGTVSGNTVTGILAGTDVTLTATLNGCTTDLEVTAPDCSCPVIAVPTDGVPAAVCFGDANVAISASVLAGETIDWYADATGGTALVSGSLSYTSSETAVDVYTYYAEARNTTTNCVSDSRLEVSFEIKANPTLTLTSKDCAADLLTYDIVFASNGTVESTAGTVSGNTVTGIPAGTDVTLTATLNGCTTDLEVTAPDCSCPVIAVPTDGVPAAVCFGDANVAISASVLAGETIDWYADATGGTALVSGSLSYTSSETAVDVYTYYAEARNTTTNCVSDSRLEVSFEIKANPTLTLTSKDCAADLLTYDIVFASNGTVESTAGTVSGNTVTGIPAGTDVTLTATLNGCTTDLEVTAPDCSCPVIAVPTDGVPAAVCFGDANVAISASVLAGETIDWYADATGGTALVSGSLSYTSSETAVDVYTYYAEARNTTTNCVSDSRLEVSFEIKANPTLTLTSKDCAADLLTYDIVFASNGTVESTAGTVSGNTVTGIPAGTDVTLTATLNGCTTDLEVTAPDCSCPVIAVPTDGVPAAVCFGDANVAISASVLAGETIDWYADATGGTALVSGSLSYTSSETAVDVYTYYAEARNTTTNCVSDSRLEVSFEIKANPTLTLTSKDCAADLLTYDIVFASNGTVESTAGTVSGNTVTGILAGTDVTLTATLNGCTTDLEVTAPDCSCPVIAVPTDGVPAAVCFGDANVAISASVLAGETIDWYADATGGTALVSGSLSYTSSETAVDVYTYYAEARNTTTNCVSDSRLEVSFEIKANPTLTLTSKDCAADLLTYDIVFASNGTVESTAGTVSGNTVTGIPAGTDVTLTATLNGCTTDLEVTAPDCSCPVIAVPTDGVPAAVCFGDANVAISASVLAGETIDWYADATGGTALVSGSLSYTSSETAVDVYTYYAEARNTTTNCVSDSRLEVSFEIKANPTLTLTSKDCAADLLTYDIVFASNGTVESTAGTVSGNTVTGIPAGTDVTLTATLNGCTTDLEVTAPDCSCPVIAVPTDGVPAAVCFGDANVAISASVLAGETIDWYADATGGTALVSGNLSYTSSETAVDVYTYYAEARNTTTNCVSDSRLEVSFEIKANPTLTLTSKDCAADLLTYDIVFASNGTVESTAGTVSGNTVTGIPAGTDVTLTATLNGCTTDLEVTAPDCSCPVIAVPTDGVPAAVCFGDANVAISASVLAGETIDWYADATGGTALVSGSLSYTSSETAVDVYTYYAEARNTTTNCVSDSRLEVSFEIKANPTLTLTSKDCAADLLTYDIVFASNGTVESTAGTVSGNTVTGILAGTDVTLTATLNGCTTDLEVTAPDCSCPVIAVPTDGVPAAVCFGDANVAISASVLAGETIDWYADATGGTALVSGSLSYTSSETAVDVYTYYAEARNTTTNCVSDSRLEVSFEIKANPTLTLTSKDCAADLLTYDIVFASNGTVESTAGTVSGNTVTGIPAGTDVTLTATLNGCTTDLEVTAPDCSCPVIAVPTDGVPAAVCFGDANVAISASVLAGETIDWYADATGGTALVSGNLSYTSSETAVDVYTYYAEARNTTTNCVSDSRLEVSFEIKANPTLTLTSKDCAADLLTYDIVFASNGTVESTAGTVSGNTVTGILAGTDVTLTATLNGCTTDLEVTAPDCSCPVIAVPTDGVPAAVCFGDANVAISASVLAGETIDWYADATGGTALVSGSLSYTSSETAVDVYTYYAEARNTTTNCVSDSRLEVSFEIKANPTLTLTSKDCAADLLTYDIVFASNGTVESTAGTVSGNTVTGIPAGTDVTLTATLNGCTTDLEVTAPDCSCPVIAVPTDGVPAAVCFGDANVAISASVLAGETIDWYADATGGTALVSGNLSYTSSETAVDVYTYYAEARNTTTNCVSDSRLEVSFEIKANPTLTLTSKDCAADLLTYDIVFVSDGGVSSTEGIVDNTTKTITGINAGTDVTLTATMNGCTTELPVTAPDCSCPVVDEPTEGVSSAICFGDPNTSISASVPTGHTIDWYADASGGTTLLSGSLSYTSSETAVGVYTYYAEARNTTTNCISSGRLAVSFEIKANPTLALTNVTCAADLQTYDIIFVSNGEVSSTAGVIDNTAKTVTGITAGTGVTLTATLNGCTTYLVVNAPYCSCPLVVAPTDGIPSAICFGETNTSISASVPAEHTIDWYSDATGGSALVAGSLSYTSSETEVGVYTYYAQARNTTTKCVSSSRLAVSFEIKANPTLELASTTCVEDLQTYNIVFVSDGGVSSTEGIVDNTTKTITGINAGTDVTLTATMNGCTTELPVTAPDCSCPVVDEPTEGVPSAICFGDPNTSISASVPAEHTIDWYDTPSGGSVLLSGSLSYTNSGTEVGVYTYYAEARNTTTNCVSSSRLAVSFEIKANPTLVLTSTTCAADLQTYDIVFVSDGEVSSTAGVIDISAKTVTGITAGTGVTLTATLNGCTTDLVVNAPDCSCPVVIAPTDGVPSEICFGDENTLISANVPTDHTIDWYQGPSGGSALLSGSLNYRSSETEVGVYTYYAEARNITNNCVSSNRLAVNFEIKAIPTLALTSATCAEDIQTYDIVFTSNGTVSSTSGIVDNTAKTVTGITAGTDVTLTTSLNGCTTDLVVNAPDCSCPDVATPTDGIPSQICFGEANTSISASVESDQTIDWYDEPSGGSVLLSGSLSYTSSKTEIGVYTYYAETRNTTTNCVSSGRLAINYEILSRPIITNLSKIDPLICQGLGSLNFKFTDVPDGTYTISFDGGTFEDVTVSSGTASVTAAVGTYNNLQITLDGCISDLGISASLTDPSPPPAPTIAVQDNCGESVITALDYTGSLLWSTGDTTESIVVTEPGSYSVIQMLNDCISDAASTIAAPKTTPTLTVTETDPVVCGEMGSLDFNFTGVPDGMYSITYDAGIFSEVMVSSNTATISAAAGAYNNLTITINDCSSAIGINASLADPNPPSAPTVSVLDSCGESVLTASNYTGTLLWSTGESTESIIVTTAGTYSVTQTVNGCMSEVASITATPQTGTLLPEIEVINNCGESTIIMQNLEENAWFFWQYNNQTDSTQNTSIKVTEEGEYTFWQKNNNCNSQESTVTVSPHTLPSLSVASNQTSIVTDPDSITPLIAEANSETNSVVVWFENESGGQEITSPVLDTIGAITYYAEALDTTTGCSSTGRTPVTLTIQMDTDTLAIDTTIFGKPHNYVAVLIFATDSLQYQWFMNGEELLNATNQFYYIFESDRQNGNIFTIEVTFPDGHSSKFNYQYNKNQSLGAIDAGNKSGHTETETFFSIYPNPASTCFTMAIDTRQIQNIQNLTAKVFSISGVCAIEIPITQIPQRINTEDLRPGVYSVILYNNEERLQAKKLSITQN
ncbi:T9SS type A sorting domain-containing protein [uncultured Draconibacterium sp.]|uniref:Ig-like domain-containing protein n=1 Tax=uncultured Draconibacterium sp. TaxID=1573823 RepID=UPI0029C6359F|nr:T9SS type A sorting domain-containing protein [uncultured Draconibacterium sp.]